MDGVLSKLVVNPVSIGNNLAKDVALPTLMIWIQLQDQHSFSRSHQAVRITGAILVSQQERIIALETTGESHAIVRAIMRSPEDPKGCDIYVSRYPCSLCTKLMIQAGIRKCYYFPAKYWEKHEISEALSSQEAKELQEKNSRSVQRLIMNNSTALSLFIPHWGETNEAADVTGFDLWELDESIGSAPGMPQRWSTIRHKFEQTARALSALILRYQTPLACRILGETTECVAKEDNQMLGVSNGIEPKPVSVSLARHAMVLAHIAAKRTDDPKVGVGAVIIVNDRYVSVGWNGYPKKSQHLDYPQAGADDSVEDEELKYDYILHAEQNALLWRNPAGLSLDTATMVSTKLPCDECSPIIYDCGVRRVITNPQPVSRSPTLDGPALAHLQEQCLQSPELAISPVLNASAISRAHSPVPNRGLSYNKINRLIDEVWLFQHQQSPLN
ncbi:hypothetical protein BJ742DRAFT_772312 [Cladochytrium replicatum]|nr:hypothetical protein BJ742DRAFT_772312 [Cladochytrium replicatum]